ncbi:putative 1-phosphatidylinositol 3-phosphate 5-kinase [Fopius arisanus]|uniref:1-phosphatidylinositol-3-phosphate 5-kinase n=1 Tax=Fopius arisanus TaxID=64838 RepID=A0A9R1U6F4_9HYME|nr:PREDICTED: putative 1-phosphatidylinositol 3-phosphate 5-kinase [Fopius arisanus]
MMNKNMNSPTKLTEFAPLSPEDNQPVVASLFSKFFTFGKSTSGTETPAVSPKDEEQSSSGDSESWRQLDSLEKTPEDDTSTQMTFPLDASEGRSLPNVLKRISNIVASKSSSLKSYKDSQLRSFWMPDSVAKQCYECTERFTTFRRRHHCRVCGQIFCSKCCSDEIPGKIMGCTGDLRVCTYCCKVVLSYLQSSDMRSVLSADLKALQEDLQVKYGDIPSPHQKTHIPEDDTAPHRKPSVGYMEEKYALGRATGSYLSPHERAAVLQNSASLRMIWEELFNSSQAIPLQTHWVRLKNYYNCFTGVELVNWMISQNKAATRVQATAIGQALLEAAFIKSIQGESSFTDTASLFIPVSLSSLQTSILDDHQSSCDAQEPAWVKNIPQHDSTTDSESETTKQINTLQIARLPSSSSSFYLDLNLEASTVTLKRPTSGDFPLFGDTEPLTPDPDKIAQDNAAVSEVLNDTLFHVQETKERSSWHKVNNLRNSFGEMSAYNSLSSAYKQHEDSLIKQLLNKEGLPQKWSDVIIPIAHQIVDQLRPDLNHDADDMDIRQYVQIKKSPGGSKSDCEIVSGVVCSKNVAHRGMNAMIANPKILLLQCGLMYQRVEGKLLSLEPVMLQENQYLEHTVGRITALGPDIVLVHRSVSRLAQDRFRQCGVTLVLNVKLSVLERVARCTGGTIVNTIDAHLTARYKLGTCKKFYLRNFPSAKNGVKTLMYFEGCANPHLGSTILLRGGSPNELKRVKNVTSTMIFAVYSWRLEKSFLMDEFARPPSNDNSFLDGDHPKGEEKRRELGESSDSPGNNTTLIQQNTSCSQSTPKTQRIEDSGTSDKFKRVSNMLQEQCDPYDTLKLFKQKSKGLTSEGNESDLPNSTDRKDTLNVSDTGSADDISILESSSEQNTFELFSGTPQEKKDINDKMTEEIPTKPKAPDDKRVYGESISDRSDPLHQYLNEDEDVFHMVSPTGQSLSVADLPLLNKFKKSLDDTILSFSPYLKFSIPYLETEPGRNCVLRGFFPKEIFYSSQFSDKVDGSRTSVSLDPPGSDFSPGLKLKPRHPFTLVKITSRVDTREVQALLSHFRACGSRLNRSNNVILERKPVISVETNDTPIWPDCLDPASHQRLPVLFCSFSHNTNDAPASFCVNPWVVNMDLYGRNDIALGRFLERYCLTTDYKCPAPSCRAQIAQHGRRFAHDGGCLQINLNQMSNDPFGQENVNQILMWSKCVECKNVSPVVPMSSDTWSLSFAKYLELRFHGNVYMNRSSETCQHSLHHDHCQYFSKGNMLAVFKYTRIKLLEISLPPPLINISYDAGQHANVIDEVKIIALKGDDVFTAIKEKLTTLQVELESLNVMKQQVAKEQLYFKNKIEEVQLKLTSPTLENKKLEGKGSVRQVQALMFRIEDGLVILKRLIAEAVSNWNSRIIEIASKKRDERPRRFTERSLTAGSSGLIDTDGYITEDTASESQMEDLSPMSADYNAIDVISAQVDAQSNDVIEHSDGEIQESPNPADIVIIQGSPKMHQRSHSDVLPMSSEDVPDRRKKKKTILSQLLPSVSNVSTIVNPLGPLEHHLLPLGSVVPIVVNESEPSSIIAYALDSHDYKHAFQEILQVVKNELSSSPLNKRKFVENKENVVETTQSGEFKRPSVLSFLRGASPSPASPSETERNFTAEVNPQGIGEIEEEKRAIKQQNYIEVQFADTTTNFYCRVYFAAQFAKLRESVLPCGEDGFTRSLCRSVQWAARGGKSGSTFCKTRDDRFILKEMSRMEMQIFLDFAPNYFGYMEKCQQNKQPTLLGKIVGVYRVSFKNNMTNAALRTSLLVMENLFYDRTITDKFDLKGSVRNRLVNPEDIDHEGELVLMDENLLNMSCDSPLYMRPHSKAVLNKAIEQDTKFLADNSVMDYSLLVGLEPKSGELVLGIIDYIRTFTWDKRLETMVKKSGILGGQGKLPTIVSPEEYRSRFIAAMHRYFLPVPDRWTGLGRGVESP